MTTIEDLMTVRQTLGRFFNRIEGPSKTEAHMHDSASRILNDAIENMDRLQRSGKRAPQVAVHLQIKEALDSMTIEEIKREVEDGNMNPGIAIMMEESGKNRSTLLTWLAEKTNEQALAAMG